MKINHIAIVGLGSIGRRHLRIFNDIKPDIEITLVRSGKGSCWPEEKLATRTVHSIGDAVKAGIQAAIISSPASEHIPQGKELADAGIHLLMEKPFSNSFIGVDNFLNASSNAGIACLMGYVLRYDPAAKKFFELLKKGLPGEPLHARIESGSYLPDWRPDQDYKKTVSALTDLGGGVLLELSHELDYIRWFFGEMASIYAYLHNSGTLGVEVEESADLIISNEHGLPISVHLDFNRRHSSRRCVLQGAKGELTWDAINKNVIWHPAGGEPNIELFEFERDYIYREQLKHFLDCIEKGASPMVTFKDGVEALRLVEAAKRSHKSGARVALT